jgi:hypothetical protein
MLVQYHDGYVGFEAASRYLMYFGLIPLLGHIVIVMMLDLCRKYNLRLTNSLLVAHEALIGIGIILTGYFYDHNNQEVKEYATKQGSLCLKDTLECYQAFLNELLKFSDSDGLSSGFTTFMIFLLALQVLCLIGIVFINILILKYYKLKEVDYPSTDYELQTL